MNDTYFFGKRMNFNEGGRARFNVGGTGNQDAKAQGFDFISNNKYLQDDFTGSEPLDFSNVSSSGIMSQAPVAKPLQYIRESDGGGNTTGPKDKDYGYTGPGSTGSVSGFDIDDIGEGTIDNEDEETGNLSIVDGLRAIGAFTIGGPFNAVSSLNKTNNRNKQKEIDKINAKINSQYGLGGILNDPNTVGGSSKDSATGGSFGSSTNEATGARGSGTGFSDYS